MCVCQQHSVSLENPNQNRTGDVGKECGHSTAEREEIGAADSVKSGGEANELRHIPGEWNHAAGPSVYRPEGAAAPGRASGGGPPVAAMKRALGPGLSQCAFG